MSDGTSWAEDTYDRNPVVAANEPEEMAEDIGELLIADYLVFLFSLDTFMRYIEERTGVAPNDDAPGADADLDAILKRGLTLLRRADRVAFTELDKIIREGLTSPGAIKMLDVAMRTLPTARGAGVRSLRLRTLLTRGGTTTTKKIFDKNPRARKEVFDAIEASMMNDADAALAKFAVITLKNKMLAGWIDLASEAAVPLTALTANPVQEAAKQVSVQAAELRTSSVLKDGADPASEESSRETTKEQNSLQVIETEARQTAQKILQKTGEEDRPVTKSEAIGIATAAAAAVTSDPTNDQNVPESLRKLDAEQRAAALTDGRVLVSAGAGAGKTTTLIARIRYLIQDRKASPTRIFVTSFNQKAANTIKADIAKNLGHDTLKMMSAGTMHSLFRRFVIEYGTPAERSSLENGFQSGGASIAGAVNRAWAQCYGDKKVPKAKDMMRYKSQWAGNGITPEQAKASAESAEEELAAEWFEWYEGFKGSLPGWKPPCNPREFETFMSRKRQGGRLRLSDFDDMLGMFRDVLRRNPGVRKMVQKMFDHIMVDECQDLNQVQMDIIMMMSEHVGDGTDGNSLWMVGDDKQSIYAFRGARPELFVGLDGAPGWTTRMIRTNYRCQPEIVELANRLIRNNANQIPMQANPDPKKTRGVASVRVQTPIDDSAGAIATIREIKLDAQAGGVEQADYTKYAILTRTNKEQHAYETACIIKGVPYARKGTASFFGSPETTAVLSYVQLATGDDCQKMQAALAAVLNKPNRFFVAPDAAAEALKTALSTFAVRSGTDIKSLNPVAALVNPAFQRDLAQKLTGQGYGFKFDKTVEKLRELGMLLGEMRTNATDPEYTMKDLFGEILNLRGIEGVMDQATGRTTYIERTFRDTLVADLKNSAGGDDDEDDREEDEDPFSQGLGNVAFLFELAKPDPDDPEDSLSDPTTPMGFKAKMERYAARMRDLRIDVVKWEKEHPGVPPPAVYIGTVHSVKGAQWPNTYVAMPKGKFPIEIRVKPGEPPPPPEKLQEHMEQERRLGYVALTRAINNLTVICPSSLGGKAAGMSIFVEEAGLAPGENVPKEGSTTKEASVDMWSLPRGASVAVDATDAPAPIPVHDIPVVPESAEPAQNSYNYGR